MHKQRRFNIETLKFELLLNNHRNELGSCLQGVQADTGLLSLRDT